MGERLIRKLKTKNMRKREDCWRKNQLEIANRNILMSDGDIMTPERINVDCECSGKTICMTIARRIEAGHLCSASDLLQELKNCKV